MLTVCCVYAPNERRGAFFSDLRERLPAAGALVMGGDFNCVCDPALDEVRRATSTGPSPRAEGGAELSALLRTLDCVDAYRSKHPHGREVTHYGTQSRGADASQRSAARLDRWYVSRAVADWWLTVQHMPCYVTAALEGETPGAASPGDHYPVLLTLTPPGLPSIGPGRRTFPHILLDPDAVECLHSGLQPLMSAIAATGTRPPGAAYASWLRAKTWTLDKSIQLARTWRAQQRAVLRAAVGTAPALAPVQAPAPAPAPAPVLVPAPAPGPGPRAQSGVCPPAAAAWPTAQSPQGARAAPADRGHQQAVRAQRELAAAADKVASGLATEQALNGEQCTRWNFQQLSAARHAPLIASLQDHSGATHDLSSVACGPDLRPVVHEHYSSASPQGLFRVGSTDPAAQARLLSFVSRKLDSQQQTDAEGPQRDGTITLACLTSALGACANGKSPGPDGLPFEAYKALWCVLAPLLAAALRDVLAHGPGGPEWAEGWVALLYKGKDLPTDRLSSYRPITLLNCDYKLVGRVVSDRLQGPLSFLIDPAQTAFIRGRWIGDNVLTRQEVAESVSESLCTPTPLSACIVSLDIEKAYDRVDRQWLMRCATTLGLPPGMLTWIERLMDTTTASVIINNFVVPGFPVDNGLPQGGPACPVLWTIQFEPFFAALRSAHAQGLFRSPRLLNVCAAPPATVHADDLDLFLTSLSTDAPAVRALLVDYERASNSRFSRTVKTQVIMLGAAPLMAADEAVRVFWEGAVMPGEDVTGGPQGQGAGVAAEHAMPAAAPAPPTPVASSAGAHAVPCPTVRAAAAAPGPAAAAPVPPPIALGVPCTADMALAARLVYSKKLQTARGRSRAWGGLGISFWGRCLIAKAMIGSLPAYHITFVPPAGPGYDFLSQLVRVLSSFVAWSDAPEDATLLDGSRQPTMRPARALAALPRHLGGLGAPDPVTHYVAMAAKPLVMSLLPGAQGWHGSLLHALSAAAPHARMGPTWLLSSMPLSLCGTVRFRHAAIIDAFRLLGVRQLSPRPGRSWPHRALLTLPLFYNPALTDADGTEFTPPAHAAACVEWPFTLGQLARVTDQLLLLDPVLVSITARLPVAWKAALLLGMAGEGALRGHDRWWVSSGGEWVRKGGANAGGPIARVSPVGVLVWPPLGTAPADAAGVSWLPACVPQVLKPQWAWTPAERAAVAAAPDPQARAAALPTQRALLGAWAAVSIYPAAWGVGELPLTEFSVAHARRLLTARAAHTAAIVHDPQHVLGGAVWPRIWARRPPNAAATPGAGVSGAGGSGDATPQPPPCNGLQALERPWVLFQRTRPAGDGARDIAADLARQGMNLRRSPLIRRAPHPRGRDGAGAGPSCGGQLSLPGPRQPPQAPRQQQQQRPPPAPLWRAGIVRHCLVLQDLAGALAASPVPTTAARPRLAPDPAAQYCRQLWQSVPVCNATKCFAVRLSHAALPCRAMSAFKFSWGRDKAGCECCSHSRGAGRVAAPLETYTHIFFECPAFAGAKDWLLDLWQHISGVRPPDTAAAIVADEPGAWPAGQQPVEERALLWQALRLTLLRHIWAARCSGDPEQQHARAVVSATVSCVRAEVQQLYNCSYMRDHLARALPPRIVRQRQQQLAFRQQPDQQRQRQQQRHPSAERLLVWLDPAIATVAPSPTGGGGAATCPAASQALLPSERLTLHLSLSHPVTAPPSP